MQTILITGAGSGIGKATAQLLSKQEKTRLLLIGRRKDILNKVISTLPNSQNHLACSVDVSNSKDLEECLSSHKANLKAHPLVSVFANAGIGGPNKFNEHDRWSEILDINLTGVYNTCMVSHPWLERAKSDGFQIRDIVVTSSCLARFGVPNQTAYVSSKTALLGLVRSLAAQWSNNGILVNAIAPGWVETEMARQSIQAMAKAEGVTYEKMHATQCSLLPTGRMSQPAEIAALVEFLFSDAQQSITGQTIDINNGSWMG